MITIRHDHADGTLVYGSSKGDGVYELIGPRTAARFRYFPSIRQIGIQSSRDRPADRWRIETAAEALRAAGFEVEIEIDDTFRDHAEVRADRADRLDARYDRLSGAAARAGREAESRAEAANQISERFAGGQPILVGHHSERRARRDHDKMDNHMRASVAAQADAERISAAASVVGDQEKYRQRPGVIRRRIDKTEAELRKVRHYINGTRPANDWRGAYDFDRKPATGGYLERLRARESWLEHQLAGDRELLAEHEANGYTLIDRSTVHKGDKVTRGRWYDRVPMEVTRVNPKSVTVKAPPSDWCPTRKVPYDEISVVECPHEQRTISANAPAVQWGREAPEVPAAEELPQPEAPIAVGAGTECFITPASVVDKMIAEAGISEGMRVLEPSAGTGAIAKRAAEAGAEVTCIELDYQLWQRLDGAGIYHSVNHGDFLEAQPGGMDGQVALYDAVLMNPPFRNQADIRHVLHALGFVKPGGIVVAVMSAGAEFRSGKLAEGFRELVASRGGWIEALPEDAFAAMGATQVRTVLAVIPAGGEEE